MDQNKAWKNKIHQDIYGPPRPNTCGYLDPSGCWQGDQACGPSDARLKRGVKTLTNSLEKLMMIDAVEYDWNSKLREYDSFKEQEKLHTIGLIAQEVKQVLDQAGVEDFGGWVKLDLSDEESDQALRYEEFISPLIKAVQELTARVQALEER